MQTTSDSQRITDIRNVMSDNEDSNLASLLKSSINHQTSFCFNRNIQISNDSTSQNNVRL